ncbi:MAG: hypothetical protein AB7K71_39495, partial [Polyangiaceae bacterium]
MPWLRTLSCLVAAGSSLLVTSCPFDGTASSRAEGAAAPAETTPPPASKAAEQPLEEPQQPAELELVALRPADRDDESGAAPETSAGEEETPALEAPEDAEDLRPVAAHPYHPDFGVDPERALTAIRKETYVFSEPNWRSKKLGYLRAGAVVKRSAEPTSRAKDCRAGWYQVEPQGYVCVGNTASTDIQDPVSVAARQMPDRSEGLPYAYGISRYPTPPFYTKLPTAKEQ